MRALRQIVGAVLLASVMAQSFINSADFMGRSLETLRKVERNDGEPGETVFPKYTIKFSNEPNTWKPDSRSAEWEGASEITWIGLGVGGGATFIFFIFAVINIIIDEVQRHADLRNKVNRVQEQLSEDYGVSQEELDEMLVEFEDKEKRGDKIDAEAERLELAAIN